MEESKFDVIIIGGSYSGLSAAMALGRALRNVLIIDSGKPCNRFAPHSHNFLTQDGKPPQQISAEAKDQVLKYNTVQFYEGLAVDAHNTETGFVVSTNTGSTFSTKKLLFATGLKDVMLPIPGFAECWGKSIIHCPYCHGYEVRNQPTAILANGDAAFHYAWLISNWTKDLTLLTNGKSSLTNEQNSQLQANNISIIETEVKEIQHENGQVQNVIFKDDSSLKVDAIYSGLPFEQHTDIPKQLGCEFSEDGHILVNSFQQTTVEGVYAAGDNSTPMRAVSVAVSSGTVAGAIINNHMALQNFEKTTSSL